MTSRISSIAESMISSASEADPKVFEAQELLARLGYNPGPADGVTGERTRVAVRAFQREVGMEPNGVINENVVARMRVAARQTGQK